MKKDSSEQVLYHILHSVIIVVRQDVPETVSFI